MPLNNPSDVALNPGVAAVIVIPNEPQACQERCFELWAPSTNVCQNNALEARNLRLLLNPKELSIQE
jgi:hypothetical protein